MPPARPCRDCCRLLLFNMAPAWLAWRHHTLWPRACTSTTFPRRPGLPMHTLPPALPCAALCCARWDLAEVGVLPGQAGTPSLWCRRLPCPALPHPSPRQVLPLCLGQPLSGLGAPAASAFLALALCLWVCSTMERVELAEAVSMPPSCTDPPSPLMPYCLLHLFPHSCGHRSQGASAWAMGPAPVRSPSPTCCALSHGATQPSCSFSIPSACVEIASIFVSLNSKVLTRGLAHPSTDPGDQVPTAPCPGRAPAAPRTCCGFSPFLIL